MKDYGISSLVACCFGMAFLAGCARSADPAAMVPNFASVGRTHPRSVTVAVSGGRETNPLWTSQVSSAHFREALQASLLKFRVFSRVINAGNADYRLEANLVRLKQPLAGFDMTVTAEVAWRLTDLRTGRVVWQQTFAEPYTATVGDAFVGVNRLALANEGAIRGGIKVGIERLSKLPL